MQAELNCRYSVGRRWTRVAIFSTASTSTGDVSLLSFANLSNVFWGYQGSENRIILYRQSRSSDTDHPGVLSTKALNTLLADWEIALILHDTTGGSLTGRLQYPAPQVLPALILLRPWYYQTATKTV